jgi:protein-S-isoprenylcysteine O-methyltransferase Ste14
LAIHPPLSTVRRKIVAPSSLFCYHGIEKENVTLVLVGHDDVALYTHLKEAEMKRLQESLYNLNPWLLSSIASVLTVAQIVLAFFLRGPRATAVEWAGWICWWTGVIFAVLPIITFRRKGGVAKGQSYMKTTVLVDTGIYAIARHPQGGTAWLLFNLAAMLIAQHWSSVVLGLVSMGLAYVDTFKSDQYCIDKFGDAYRQYMQRVPRVNFVLGLIRLAWHKAKAQ